MSSTSESTSFLSNTLKRRHQKRQEVAKVLQEGISSLHLSSPVTDHQQSAAHEGIYPLLNIDPDSYVLDEGDERSMLEPSSYHDPEFKQTVTILLNWLNSTLSQDEIIVRSLEEDLYDGYILAKLIKHYHQSTIQLLHDEIPLSQESKKKTLENVLRYLDSCFQQQEQQNQPIRWTFAQIFNKDFIAILHLLIALMKLWNVKTFYQLPKTLILKVIVVKKVHGILQTRTVHERFIDEHERDIQAMPTSSKDDLIDALFDLAPNKIPSIEKTLLNFINSYLNHHNIHIQQIDIAHFQDGLNLLYLIAQLENYFLIMNKYYQKKPITREQSYANIQLAFELMNQAGLDMERYCRINELLAGNQRTLYRLLFQLYLRYNADSNNLLESITYLRTDPSNVDSPFL